MLATRLGFRVCFAGPDGLVIDWSRDWRPLGLGGLLNPQGCPEATWRFMVLSNPILTVLLTQLSSSWGYSRGVYVGSSKSYTCHGLLRSCASISFLGFLREGGFMGREVPKKNLGEA